MSEIKKDLNSLVTYLNPKKTKNTIGSTPYYKFNCHMNPSVHVSPIIHYIVVLTMKHNLSYEEVVSCLIAWSRIKYTVFFIVRLAFN